MRPVVLAVVLLCACGDPCPDEDGDGALAATCGGADCDDADPARSPDAADDVGDEVDQDCDGADGIDRDGDGHATPESGGDDCDDAAADRFPGAADTVGDEVDQDCDGLDGVDEDQDGAASVESGGEDCDDLDATRGPEVADTVGDGLDQDCDGVDGEDADGDAHPSVESGGDDCDDARGDTFPGAADEAGDGVDQNCDGVDGVDADGDGWASEVSGGEDCDDAAESVNPDRPDGLPEWEVVVADEDAFWADLALDPAGAPAIAWTPRSEWSVRLSSRATGSWATSDVDTTDLPGWSPGLAFDLLGVAHVAYGELDNNAITYASNAGGTFASGPVDAGSTVAIAVGPDDAPRIAYDWFGPGRHGLSVATLVGADWQVEDVPLDGPTALPALAVDAGGASHVCSGQQDVWYATDAGGPWVTQQIAPDVGITAGCDLVLDPAGVPHVVVTGPSVQYGVPGATGFDLTTVATGDDPVGAELGLDADGYVYLVWQTWNLGNPDLWYASNRTGTFEVMPLATAGAVGYAPSMAVDADGLAHVTWSDPGAREVLYGVVAPQNGVDDDCDGVIW